MAKHKKYTPKHRVDPAVASARRAPKRILRTGALLTGLAAAVTGVTVAGGLATGELGTGGLLAGGQVSSSADQPNAADALRQARVRLAAEGSAATDSSAAGAAGAGVDQNGADAIEREPVISRSDTRGSTDEAKAAALGQSSGKGMSATADMSGEDPREIAKALLTEFGFGQDQFGCLDSLYEGESHWRVNADNPHSSAYGIPQALPGSKMASAGPDWATNPVTQIRWGLGYIQGRYGTPCGAWSFKRSHGWY